MKIQHNVGDTMISTKQVSSHLLQEIVKAIKNIKGYGSVEIYIQNYKVVQITERNIRKPLFPENGKNGKTEDLIS